MEVVFVYVFPAVLISNFPSETLIHGPRPWQLAWLAGIAVADGDCIFEFRALLAQGIEVDGDAGGRADLVTTAVREDHLSEAELAERVAEVVQEEMTAIARDGLTAEELEDVRGQMRGQLVLSLESTSARLGRVVGTALYGEPFQTAEELLEKVEAVTAEEIAALAGEYLDPARQTVVRLGPAN